MFLLDYGIKAQRLRHCNRSIDSWLQFNCSDIAVWSCAHKAPRRMVGQMRGRSILWTWVNTYVLCLHHTVHPRHNHRHQVLSMYSQIYVEVMLVLQIQWTKLWHANKLNQILIRGVSIVWRNLDFWLTVLQWHASLVRHTCKIGWLPRPSRTWVDL